MVKANYSAGATGALSGAATGAALGSVVPGIGTAIGAVGGGLVGGLTGLFGGGSEEKHKRVSTLLPEQQRLYQQLQQALTRKGAGGAYGESADYYRDLLDPNSQTAQMMMAPESRKFNEEIIPGLAEQFAGMGAGGLTSSGFRNESINAGTDLAERLGSIRAQLRAQGAQGLANLGNIGLGNFSQDVMTQPGVPSFGETAGPGIGSAMTSMGTDFLKDYLNNPKNKSTAPGQTSLGGQKVGMNTSPYGNQGFQLPNFQTSMKGGY